MGCSCASCLQGIHLLQSPHTFTSTQKNRVTICQFINRRHEHPLGADPRDAANGWNSSRCCSASARGHHCWGAAGEKKHVNGSKWTTKAVSDLGPEQMRRSGVMLHCGSDAPHQQYGENSWKQQRFKLNVFSEAHSADGCNWVARTSFPCNHSRGCYLTLLT